MREDRGGEGKGRGEREILAQYSCHVVMYIEVCHPLIVPWRREERRGERGRKRGEENEKRERKGKERGRKGKERGGGGM